MAATATVCLLAILTVASARGASISTGLQTCGARCLPYALPPDVHSQVNQSRGAVVVWSTTHNFLGCVSPKVGCSNWLHYLRKMLLPPAVFDEIYASRRVYQHQSYDEHGLHFRRHSEMQRYAEILNNATIFKFAVVRHPWRRLVSAFRSKFEGECRFDRTCLREVFGVPVNASTTALTFDEFVQALAASDPVSLDKHFRPQHLLCEIDRVPYDFIGDLNTPADMAHISARLGLPATFAQIEDEAARKVFAPAHYYGGRTHAVQPCTRATVLAAIRLYGRDAELLGLNFDDAMAACTESGLSSRELPSGPSTKAPL